MAILESAENKFLQEGFMNKNLSHLKIRVILRDSDVNSADRYRKSVENFPYLLTNERIMKGYK